MSSEAAGSAPESAMAGVGATSGRAAPPSTHGEVPAGAPGSAEPRRSARVAWIVIGIAMAIGAALGVFVYLRAADGSVVIAHDFKAMRERGAQLEAEVCVEESLAWFNDRCDAVGKMCIDAVPRMVGECLAARDRSEACGRIGNDLKPSQWAYDKCKAIGIDRHSKKPVKESCTLAWRAFDSWCKSGQKGVAL